MVALASATVSEEEKKLSVSKSKNKNEFNLPYLSKKFGSARLEMETAPTTISKKNSLVSSSQATSSVLKTEHITQVFAANAEVPKDRVKPSLTLTVDIPQYKIPKEKFPVSSTRITTPLSKAEAITQIPAKNADSPKKGASSSVAETQASYY